MKFKYLLVRKTNAGQPDARLPSGVTSTALLAFRDGLVERLTVAARPTELTEDAAAARPR